MVSRRLVTASETKGVEVPVPERHQQPQFGVVWIPVLIILVFAVYHGFGLYHQETLESQKLEKEGKSCLLEFKMQQCNPLSLTDECAKLA